MQLKCDICNSLNVEIIDNSKTKESDNYLDKPYFSPTNSDFYFFHKFVKCKDCGFKFVLSSEDAKVVDECYSEYKDELYLAQRNERRAVFERILSDISILLQKNEKPRILDVGCSYGFLLEIAKEKGFDAYGVELSRDAVEYCKQKLGLNVFLGHIEDAGYDDCFFDVITAVDVIEHIPNPAQFILELKKKLKMSGILYLTTPDTDSVTAKIFKNRWWSYRRMHISYFSKRSLCYFLERNDFCIKIARPFLKTFNIFYILSALDHCYLNSRAKNILSFLKKHLSFIKLLITSSFGDVEIICRKTAHRL